MSQTMRTSTASKGIRVAAVMGLAAAFALGTGAAEASFIMPQSWDFGTDPGKDDLQGFDEHDDGHSPDINLTSDGVDMQGRVAISTGFTNLGEGANADFTARALADWNTNSSRDFNRIGIGMLGTETGDGVIVAGGDHLVFGLWDGEWDPRPLGAVVFVEGGLQGDETVVGDISDLISGWVSDDPRLVELLVNAVYDTGAGTITFDWTVTLVDEADPTNTASRSSADPGQQSFTVDIADFDGPRFGFAYRGHNADGAPAVNLKEFEVIPEPASLALLGIGGLVLLRRRSRQA